MGIYKQLHIDIVNLLLDSDIDSINITGNGQQKTVTIVINDIDIENQDDEIDYDSIPRTLT